MTGVEPLRLKGQGLALAEVREVARAGRLVVLDEAARARMQVSRDRIEAVVRGGEVVYGVNTGFGALKDRRIPDGSLAQLQQNLLRSHAAGVGEPFPADVVRAMLLLRANALAVGASGIRPLVVDRLLEMLRLDLLPEVPCQGSVGASGDLAPLAHLALPLTGEGWVRHRGLRCRAAEALAAEGLEPLELEAKEGLALINGTQAMTAVGVLAAEDALALFRLADVAAALSVDALLGSRQPFDPEFHALRPHAGQAASAANLWRLLDGSPIMASHVDCDRVQDPYSLRCTPQVHGASRDTLDHVRRVLEIEINSATDNPLILSGSGQVRTGGHFHGQPVALVMDFLKVAACEVANLSGCRLERLVNPHYSQGLPAFLTPDGGLHSGYMIAQYTAAALVSENKVLAHPASVDSIPTGAGQEDHVSMGTIAARQAAQIVANLTHVLALELLCAIQALGFRAPLVPGEAARALVAEVRREVPPLAEDRHVGDDVAALVRLVREGRLLAVAENVVGALA